MRILVTGSCGLIGGEAVEYFGTRGHEIVGVDNNMRAKFFGPEGDTLWNLHRVAHKVPSYTHHETDLRDDDGCGHYGQGSALKTYVFTGKPFDAIIHCAAQPSHDFASKNPQLDYEVNVIGTRNLLRAAQNHSSNAVFIMMSTNKVYDDAVNSANYNVRHTYTELPTRYDREGWNGFDESTPTGASNVFGQHKLEADELVRSYARQYGFAAVVLRGGCLTGPGHSGVELHGFLSYLLKCAINGTTYKIFGYQGKQVRDNIHSLDVCRAMEEIIKNPRPGEVYNIGGGRENSVSIIEAITKIEQLTGLKIKTEYVDTPRSGDHLCYITDLSKLKSHYPNWSITKSINETLAEMIQQDYWGKYSDHEDTKTYDLGSESLVVDVGGYRGDFSDDLIKRYNPHVFIFEPVEEFFNDCQRRFAGNPKVALYHLGLSNEDKHITIYKQGQNSSSFRGGPGQEQLPSDRVYGVPIAEEIELRDAAESLELIRYANSEIDLLSLNCEGGEFEIIPRLIETGSIKLIKNLQVQFHRFAEGADEKRESIREALLATHEERFCYPWVWESWRRRA